MELTHQELIDLLKDYSGEISISYENCPSLRKSGNPFHLHGQKVTCITDSMYHFGGSSYTERVNDALRSESMEPSFTSSEKLPWGTWLIPNRVIENNGNYYLRVYKAFKPNFIQYFVDGIPATFDQLNTINSLRIQKTYNESGQGGLSPDKRVSLVNLAFSGIKYVILDGTLYNIKH